MDFRFYTAQLEIPGVSKGDVAGKNAPLYPGASGPKQGWLGYHKASALSIALRDLLVKAVKSGAVLVTLDVTVSNLRSEDDKGNKLKIASMKPEEVKFHDAIHLGRLTAPLRQKMVDIFKGVATTAEQKVMLANITNDEPFKEYIKLNPSVIDVLREHDDFKHLKVIIYPSGGPDTTEFMVSVKGVPEEDIHIRPIGPVKGINFKPPQEALDKGRDSLFVQNNVAQLNAKNSITFRP